MVTAVGGLRDTIISYPAENATGFVFPSAAPESFLDAIRQAVRVWEDKDRWTRLRYNAMRANFSWEKSSLRYMDIYRSLHGDIFS